MPASTLKTGNNAAEPINKVQGVRVVRGWMMMRRFRNVAAKSHQFMLPNDWTDHHFAGSEFKIPSAPRAPSKREQLRQLLDARHARANLFGAHLFTNPAWDILLLAYVALLDQERLLISSLCRASLVPATTMLRWIKVLERDGLMICHKDPLDNPQSWVELSSAGKLGMERFLTLMSPELPA